MIASVRSFTAALLVAATIVTIASPRVAAAEDAAGLRADAGAALNSLYAQTPSSKVLAGSAKAILVFPNVVKAGFIGGVQYGEGALMRGGKWAGYYNTIQGSVGFQAGVEKFAYALFFMTGSAAKYLDDSDGWELGVGPEIVVIDVGGAAQLSTTTAHKDIYAFFFDPKGLMGGVSIQGTKVTRITK